MKRKLITIIFFLINININATSYFVAKNGNDNSIGSENFPWLTIQKAAYTIIAGDTLFIKVGTYNERVVVENSGSEGNYIVFTNYKDDVVTINGSKNSWGGIGNGLFDVSDNNFIEISGLKIINADYGGIWANNSNHIIIKNNFTKNTFSCGIGIWNSSYVTVENNEVELACNDGGEECISIANSYNCNIFNNTVHHNGPGTNGGEGIDVKQGSHNVNIYQNKVHHLNNRIGIYADAWDTLTYNINIYQNIVYNCSESGIAVASEKGGLIEKVNIYNNIIYSNKYGGIEIGDWSDVGFKGPKPIEHIKIINNTCFKNGSYLDGWGFGIVIDNPLAKDVVIRNNICSKNSAQIAIQRVAIDSSGKKLYIADHNLLFGNNKTENNKTIFGSDSVIANPLFVDATMFNFKLQKGSPAINTGSTTDAPNYDFDNNIRPNNGKIDIGAFEYYSTTSTTDEHHEINGFHLFQNYPNPFNPNTKITYEIPLFENVWGWFVTLKIYNSIGQEIATLVNKKQDAGVYEVEFNTSTSSSTASELASGIYYYKLQINISGMVSNYTETKKMILLR